MNDMKTPDRFDFHDWYLERYGEEYPYTYSQMHRILADIENPHEKNVLTILVEQYYRSKYVKVEGIVKKEKKYEHCRKCHGTGSISRLQSYGAFNNWVYDGCRDCHGIGEKEVKT